MTFLKILLLFLFISKNLWAININLFQQSHSPDFTYTEDSLRKYSIYNEQFIFSGFYQYNDDPLIKTNEDRTQQRSTIIDSYDSFSLNAAVLTSSRLLIGINSSINQVYLSEDTEKNSYYSLGDTNLTIKHRLSANRSKYSFAIASNIELPTGNESLYLSNEGVGIGGKMILERDYKLFKLVGNLGFMYNPKARLEEIDYTKRVLMNLGVHVPLIGDELALNIEGTTARTLPFSSYQNPGEVYTGVNYKATKEWMISGGASFGNIKVAGLANAQSNDFRIIAGLKYIPRVQRTQNFNFLSKNLSKEQKRIIKRIIQINDEIKFRHDSYALTKESEQALKKIANLLKDNSEHFSALLIEGHANKLGDEGYNDKLSFHRASVVREFLIKSGVSDKRLVPIAHGEDKPKKLDLDHHKLLELNRRVEFNLK